jgi:alginate O-acetyltransferase complex protein AlgI
VGISFFTFQGMSYIIDAYRGRVPVNRRFTDIALYISLFPQLIAGPIVNYKDIALQLHERRHSPALFAAGIDRFITGLAKKILIGDVLGEAYARIFGAFARGTDSASVWLAVICFTFHIYFDFSAYSDMAVGLGRMFGFDIMENFNYPYISASVTEFWRRWHISLSTWFRDYLYIPLGGNRRGNVYVNLFIVFCATGIWHGASWQFLLWGLWHGLFLIIEKALAKRGVTDKIPRAAGWAFTMFVAVMGWVMFAADGVGGALELYRAMFGISSPGHVEFTWRYYLDSRVLATLILAAIGSGPVISRIGKRLKNNAAAVIIKRAALTGLLALCIINAVSGTYSPFIYFRF